MIGLQTAAAFLLALGVLVTFHEFGHYLAARWCGVKVLRFSVGMGRIVYARKFGKDQTEWALSILPLGGYVKMLDAREQDMREVPARDLPREFCRQPVWKRILIVAAGPLANFLLAVLLFTGLYIHGVAEPSAKIRITTQQVPAYQAGLRHGDTIIAVDDEAISTWGELRLKLIDAALEKRDAQVALERANPDRAGAVSRFSITLPTGQLAAKDLEDDFPAQLGFSLFRPPAVVERVLDGGPAALAGLQRGDRILAIDDVPVQDSLALIETINNAPGKPLKLYVQGKRDQFEIKVTPVAEQANGKSIGRLKMQVLLAPEMTIVQRDPVDAAVSAARKTWDTGLLTFKMIGRMVTGDVSWKNITGPITIADYAGQTSRSGVISYLSFIALISISLGVMNLLPVPVLDGGHLLYYALEVLTGKPVPERFGELAQRLGVALLIALMAIAFFNDIVRLMS